MFGFAHFFDPDNGDFIPWRPGDTRVIPPIKNTHFILDGDVSTVYRSVHSKPYNNNCIGFVKGYDCSVKGVGGVSGSDHRGVNFDGDDTYTHDLGGSVNCEIDIAYCDNVVDNPVMIAGDKIPGKPYPVASLCKIHVGRVGKMLAGGYNNPIVARVVHGYDFEISIGSFTGDNIIKPALVGAYNCENVKVRATYVNGASKLLYQYETLDSDVKAIEVYNTPIGIERSGVNVNRMRTAKLHGIKATDSNFVFAYSGGSGVDGFTKLEICKNNFAYVGTGFRYYNGDAAIGRPIRRDIYDNIPPSGGMTVTELNRYSGGITGNLVTPGSSTASINFKSPDWNYGVMTVMVSNAGLNYSFDIDIRSRITTSQSVVYTVGAAVITTTYSGGNIIVLSANTGWSIQTIILHN